MAITYGFYNSSNGDRKYNAEQISSIFDGVIRDGVFQSIGEYLATKPGTGMKVIVSPGKAWFDHTWTINDAALPLTISKADVSLKRYDAVVLEVDSTKTVRANTIKVVKGTAASTPKKPTLIDTDTVHQYPLAYVLVNAGVTKILAQNIEIMVGKPECPFVTSILESVSIEALLAKWDDEFRTWFDNLQDQMGDNVATNLQNQITRNAPSVGDIVMSYNDAKSGPWLKCDGRTFSKSTYPDLYTELKSACSFEKPIPSIHGVDACIFLGNKGFFFKDDTVYVSDSLWTGPVESHSFSIKKVFASYSKNPVPHFSFANGVYFMTLGVIKVDSTYKAIFATSPNGYTWSVKSPVFLSGSSAGRLIGVVYHRSKYAFIYGQSTAIFVSYLSGFSPTSITEGTLIGYAASPVYYLSSDGDTIYIMDQDAELYDQNWKIGANGTPSSFELGKPSSSSSWFCIFEKGGLIYRAYVSPESSGKGKVVTLSKEGSRTNTTGPSIIDKHGYDMNGMDIVEDGENVYALVGSNVLLLEDSNISVVRDDFPFNIGSSLIYLGGTRANANSHYAIADWAKSIIFASHYRKISATGLDVSDYGVRTNSPEITPYIETNQGYAYIRSEK